AEDGIRDGHVTGVQTCALPISRPIINLFSGGKHAGNQAPLQDVLVAPMAVQSISDALAMTFEVYQSAAKLIFKKYGLRLLRADRSEERRVGKECRGRWSGDD